VPRKQIYIREADIELFEKAERLEGENLSAVIAEAVRRYIEVKDAEDQGMKEVTLTVGMLRSRGDDDTRKIRFVGRKLASAETFHGQTSDGRDRGTEYEIYQTKAGKIVAWWKSWTRWDGENDILDYDVFGELPGYDTEVWGKVHGDNLPPERFPGDLLQDAAEALGKEMVEYID
jgi:hypothetical protein